MFAYYFVVEILVFGVVGVGNQHFEVVEVALQIQILLRDVLHDDVVVVGRALLVPKVQVFFEGRLVGTLQDVLQLLAHLPGHLQEQ